MLSEPTGAGQRWRPSPRLVTGIVVGLLSLAFILQNTGSIRVHLLFLHMDNPAWVWLLVLFSAGFVLGSVFPWFRRRNRSATGPAQGPGPNG